MRVRFLVAALVVAVSLGAASGGALGQSPETVEASLVSGALPNPDAEGRYHIGDGVSGPELISSVGPDFTARHVRRHFNGRSAVALTVDATGRPRNVRLVRSIGGGRAKILQADAAELDRNAVEAVRQYLFRPAMLGGKAVAVEIWVEVDLEVI